jgi:hypothetical protein
MCEQSKNRTISTFSVELLAGPLVAAVLHWEDVGHSGVAQGHVIRHWAQVLCIGAVAVKSDGPIRSHVTYEKSFAPSKYCIKYMKKLQMVYAS